jgi:hypothetical protein
VMALATVLITEKGRLFVQHHPAKPVPSTPGKAR